MFNRHLVWFTYPVKTSIKKVNVLRIISFQFVDMVTNRICNSIGHTKAIHSRRLQNELAKWQHTVGFDGLNHLDLLGKSEQRHVTKTLHPLLYRDQEYAQSQAPMVYEFPNSGFYGKPGNKK